MEQFYSYGVHAALGVYGLDKLAGDAPLGWWDKHFGGSRSGFETDSGDFYAGRRTAPTGGTANGAEKATTPVAPPKRVITHSVDKIRQQTGY